MIDVNYDNIKLDLLTKEQAIGGSSLEIFKKYGTRAAATDFAILLGGAVNEMFLYTSDGESIENRSADYYIKTKPIVYCDNIINYQGLLASRYLLNTDGIIRPIFKCRFTNHYNYYINSSGFLEIEYGEYPQKEVYGFWREILNKEYSNNNLKETGKNYTVNSLWGIDASKKFKSQQLTEYYYNGKKFVRIVVPTLYASKVSNSLHTGNYFETSHWVEVQPIKWLIDEKTNIAICKKGIVSNVRYSKNLDNSNYNDTELKWFIDTCLSKDIIPSNYKGNFQKSTFNSDIIKLAESVKESINELPETIKNIMITKLNLIIENFYKDKETEDKMLPSFDSFTKSTLELDKRNFGDARKKFDLELDYLKFSIELQKRYISFLKEIEEIKSIIGSKNTLIDNPITLKEKICALSYYIDTLTIEYQKIELNKLRELLDTSEEKYKLLLEKSINSKIDSPSIDSEYTIKNNLEINITNMLEDAKAKSIYLKPFKEVIDAINSDKKEKNITGSLVNLINAIKYDISLFKSKKIKDIFNNKYLKITNKYKYLINNFIDENKSYTELEKEIRADLHVFLVEISNNVAIDIIEYKLERTKDIFENYNEKEAPKSVMELYVKELKEKIDYSSLNNKIKEELNFRLNIELESIETLINSSSIKDEKELNELERIINDRLAEFTINLMAYIKAYEEYDKNVFNNLAISSTIENRNK